MVRGLPDPHVSLVRAHISKDIPLTPDLLQDTNRAIAFIEAHSMDHSDGIVSRDPGHISRFLDEVDSCGVFANCSSRFNDGGQFGLGAEVAISTQRIHARGPMGLRELTSYKWVVEGDGQIRPS